MFSLKKRKAFSLFFCFIIFFSQLFSFQVSAKKTVGELKNEIENYRKELSRLEKDQSEQSQYQITLSKQIDALYQQIQAFDSQIGELNAQISEKQSTIDKLNEQIFEYESQINKMKENIDALESEKKATEDQLRERMKENYLCERSGALNVLLSSEDFGDFISNVFYLQKIAEFDKKLTDKLDMQVDEINKEKAKIEDIVAKINKDKNIVTSSLNEVQRKVDELNAAKGRQKATSDELAQQLKNSTRQSNNIEQAKKRVQSAQARAQCELEDATDTIRSLQSRNQGRFRGPVDVGGYLYPVASPCHFIRGYNPSTPHYGVDIGAPESTPIFASRGGVVIASRFGVRGDGLGGYGNVVVIDHGDGYSTLYGHMIRRNVRVGEVVNRGQCIGLVGNTGESLSNHCHFEVRCSGRPIPTPFG